MCQNDFNDLQQFSGQGNELDLGVGRGPAFGPGGRPAHSSMQLPGSRDDFSTFSATGVIIPGGVRNQLTYVGSIPPSQLRALGSGRVTVVQRQDGKQMVVNTINGRVPGVPDGTGPWWKR